MAKLYVVLGGLLLRMTLFDRTSSSHVDYIKPSHHRTAQHARPSFMFFNVSKSKF
jgi:hypothetical protein